MHKVIPPVCLAAHHWDEQGSEDGLRCFQDVTEISVPPSGIEPELPPLPAACQPSWWTTHHERLAKAPCGGMLALACLLCPMAGCWTLSHQHLKGMWPHAFSILVLSFLFHFVCLRTVQGRHTSNRRQPQNHQAKGLVWSHRKISSQQTPPHCWGTRFPSQGQALRSTNPFPLPPS